MLGRFWEVEADLQDIAIVLSVAMILYGALEEEGGDDGRRRREENDEERRRQLRRRRRSIQASA